MAIPMLASYLSVLLVMVVSFFLGNLFFNLLFYKRQREKDTKTKPKTWIFLYRPFFRDRLVFFDEISRFYLGFFLFNLFCFVFANCFSNVRIGIFFVYLLGIFVSLISLIIILMGLKRDVKSTNIEKGTDIFLDTKKNKEQKVKANSSLKLDSFLLWVKGQLKGFRHFKSIGGILNIVIILGFFIASIIIINSFFFNNSSGDYKLFFYAWGDFWVHAPFTQSFVYSNNINPIITPFYSGAEFFYPPMADFNSAVLQILGSGYVNSYLFSEIFIFFGIFYFLFCFLKLFLDSKWAVFGVIAILFFPGIFFLVGNGMQTIYNAMAEFLSFDLNASKELLAKGYEGYPHLNNSGIDNIGILFYCILIPQKTFAFGFAFFLTLFCLFLYSREKNFSISILKIRKFRFKEITKGLFSKIDFGVFLQGVILGSIGLFHAHILLCIGIILFLLVLIFDNKDIKDLFFGLLFSGFVFSVKTIFFSVSNKSYIKPQILVDRMGEANGIIATFSKIFFGQNLLIPILLFVFLLFGIFKSLRRGDIDKKSLFRNMMILFFIVSVPIFIANFVMFSPNWFDNGKVHHFIFIFYFCFLLFFVYTLKGKRLLKKVFVISLILIYLICYVVIFDYMLSNRYSFVNEREIKIGLILGERLDGVYALADVSYPGDSILSNVAGLISYMGYEGHVWSHGYDTSRKDNVTKLFHSKDLKLVCDIVSNDNISYVIFRGNSINDKLRESFLFYIDNFEIVYYDSKNFSEFEERIKKDEEFIEEIDLMETDIKRPYFSDGLIIFEVLKGCKNK